MDKTAIEVLQELKEHQNTLSATGFAGCETCLEFFNKLEQLIIEQGVIIDAAKDLIKVIDNDIKAKFEIAKTTNLLNIYDGKDVCIYQNLKSLLNKEIQD